MMRSPIVLVLVLVVSACGDNAASRGGDASAPDMRVDDGFCMATGRPIATETCDGVDNDCDGQIDEDFDLEQSSIHCGACDRPCNLGNAEAACVEGRCVVVGCPPGSADADGDPRNGCEDTCAVVVGDETCDGLDNDCDGRIDEDWDLDSDLDNCGQCGVVCGFDRGLALCDGGACRLSGCSPGWGNLDGDDQNGCEAPCQPTNPGPEVCDEEDNDCDGSTDEGFDTMLDPEHCGGCDDTCAFANAAALCAGGVCLLANCDPGFVDADGAPVNGCESRCAPSNDGVDICDEVDNDCNGVVDDGFDKENDVENCGGCGALDEAHICRLPSAVSACDDGVCAVERCEPGFSDADGAPGNGCETPCRETNDGVELCDRIDNDCDGVVDDGFDKERDLDHCGACNTPCETGNAEPLCDAGRCVIADCPEGFVDRDHNPRNGCEYACAPTEDPAEICDQVDNDCNGRVDDGFDILTNLEHCGGCNEPCEPAHALAICNNGVCDAGGCDDGWFDQNADIADGCELECTLSVDGFELCDNEDNDCDGEVDEDFDFQNDPNYCGDCDTECTFQNGVARCVGGECEPGECQIGWADLNEDPADGCEYGCIASDPPDEVCDLIDNDCEGDIDEGFDTDLDLDHCGGCNTPCRYENASTACNAGRCALVDCADGFADINLNPLDGCEAACDGDPRNDELCNRVDDDCDGEIDEDFDLTSDVMHCGACNAPCRLGGATPFCNNGECRVLACNEGFVNTDGDDQNGCECRRSNGGVEICDRLDNDCNGVVDDAERLVPPPEFGCLSLGVCQGTRPVCGLGAWTCPYPMAYEATEQSCDSRDNDCDGQTDEGFPGLSAPCSDGNGICREQGTLRCNNARNGTECSATARLDRAVNETCNDLDDDCDGNTDENTDRYVVIPAGGGVNAFLLYTFEASRPDATDFDPGISFSRACSKPDALPWANVDYATASAACQASGASLCSAAQWGRACAGNNNQRYPYGQNYQAVTCNGQDFDTDAMIAGNQDEAIPTGTLNGCVRGWPLPAYDLSGNVWEWTTEDVSAARDGSARAIRGGSFGNIAGGLTCQFTNAAPAIGFRENIGFRCCAGL